MTYSEDDIVHHYCNGSARDSQLGGYVNARRVSNPCVQDILERLDIDIVSAITNPDDCAELVRRGLNEFKGDTRGRNLLGWLSLVTSGGRLALSLIRLFGN
eukprot:CAMPEP_0198249954 /NCGR_PEP_ID=MMETSP1447-20131203/1311_1 /TAXON_ID=420782 /ORGANISM="Chaetoceros dichaeta, Strain CCMP1751" /LENGTH=100 /DNA_ID=CAMNT_0043934705 /DNA_START=214 /DNA_END=516 /DNA_ORIENTATION=+